MADLAGWGLRFVADAVDNGQGWVFAKTRIGLGEVAHDKHTASGTFDDFDMLARGAKANAYARIHN